MKRSLGILLVGGALLLIGAPVRAEGDGEASAPAAGTASGAATAAPASPEAPARSAPAPAQPEASDEATPTPPADEATGAAEGDPYARDPYEEVEPPADDGGVAGDARPDVRVAPGHDAGVAPEPYAVDPYEADPYDDDADE